MTYQEFYCNPSTGSQMNGGFPESGGIYPYTKTNGNWNSGTGVFTVASGNPQSDGITVGDYAAVYNDGATTPVFSGRVTARTTTTITVDVTTNKWGTPPTTSATGRTITVGGSLKGPNAADSYPFGSFTSSMTNANGNPVRVDLKNNASYVISANITMSQGGIVMQGYSSTAGDGGRAVIDCNANAIVGINISASNCCLIDLEVKNNGSSGTNNAITNTGAGILYWRVVCRDIRGGGINAVGTGCLALECEAYNCNKSNTANLGGFNVGLGHCIRCISHDNSTGSNCHGFVLTGAASGVGLKDCIAETNAGSGIKITSSGIYTIDGCDLYNNTLNGIDATTSASAQMFVLNCNVIKNGSTGIAHSSTATFPAFLFNNGYGSGTQANGGSGATSGRGIQETGAVTYASNVTPWVDPANGDFRINLAAAIGAGRGSFLQTAASYAGTDSAPIIGAAQLAGYPAVTDVKSGVTYANAAYTGTYTVPPNSARVVGGSLVQ